MNYHRNEHYLTLSKAAKVTGKSKSVISNALKTGEISYLSKDEDGYKIDPSELFRVFPKNDNITSSSYRLRTQENVYENAIKLREAEIRLEAALQERNFFREQLAKMENDRDDWKQQAQKLLLTYKSVETPAPKRGFLRWLFAWN